MYAIRDEFVTKGPFNANYGVDKALKAISEYRQMMQTASEQELNLSKGLAVFKLEQTPNKEIGLINNELELLSQIWQLNQQWSSTYDAWRSKPFMELESAEMEESVQKFQKRLQKMGKEMKDWDVYQVAKDKVNQLRRIIPVLQDLRNPALRDRHWTQLMDEIGKTFDPKSEGFSLEKILEIGLDQYGES
jgi:dynein heavy chain, axonemal